MKRLCTILVVIWALAAPSVEAGENLLIPGADFSQLTLKTGAWCRYRVVDEALGQVDSSEVYIAVLSSQQDERGPTVWVEMETRPLGESMGEAEVMKLLISEEITDFSEGDSLGDYVLELYIKTGIAQARKEDPDRYKSFPLVTPSADTSWVTHPDAAVSTAAGEFSCQRKTRHVRDERKIPTGNITLIKRSEDNFDVWFCTEIPIFHMAKCMIERFRDTETVPRMPGVPLTGKRGSKTTAELVAFGFDAKPLLSLESVHQ